MRTSETIADKGHIVDSVRAHMNAMQTRVDLDSLLDQVGDARIVMLGEASHGTHEYYAWRSIISQRLIQEKGFNFIAVEGDWPDCYRLNRYIKNFSGAGSSAFEVLHAFDRWPTWMWGNWETVAMAEWLSDHDRSLSAGKKVGFYGLDIYSLWESMEAIINYLRKVDPSALLVAERAFNCFAPYQQEEGRSYSHASAMVPEPCTQEVVNLLTEIQRRAPRYNSDPENVFSAEQNAIISVNAEKYYRRMLEGGATTWNIRDSHMMETLDRLLSFYGPGSKAIVWAHNTHIGDARATDMRFQGMHNIGELARKNYGEKDVFLVGFGSFEGSVIAARNWGDGMERMPLPPAIAGSWESILKETGTQNGYLFMKEFRESAALDFEIGHRAVGVVYNPSSEKRNYVPTLLPLRYDAFVFLRQTKGLHPLSIAQNKGQTPETYPFGV